MSECSVKHLKWGATWPSRGRGPPRARPRTPPAGQKS